MPRSSALAAVLLLICAVRVAASPPPPDRPEVRNVLVGEAGDAELLTIVHAYRDPDDATATKVRTTIRRRSVGAEAGDWATVARYARPASAVVALGERELAVLLDAPPADAATRPGMPEVRRLTVSSDLPSISDPRFDPRAVPVEAVVPPPPGVRLLDLAASRGTLFALGDDAGLWQLGEAGWSRAIDLPDGLAPVGADLASGDRVALAGRLGGEVGVWVVRQVDSAAAWEEVGSVEAAEFRLVPGVAATLGGPMLVAWDGAESRVVRFRDGGTEAVPVDWTLAQDHAGGVTDDGEPFVAGGAAAGAVRLVRRVERTPDAAESANGRHLLVRTSLDPTTLRPTGDPPPARPVDLGGGFAGPRLGEAMPLLLYGALVFLSLGALRKPTAENAPAADVAGDLAAYGPRLAAAAFDALPLLFVVGLLLSAGGRMTGEGRWLLAAAGVVAYLGLPMAGEMTVGRSAGKAILGLRVVRAADGAPCPAGAAVVRNLLRPADLLVLAVPMFLTKKRQRLGDLAAKTAVVRSPVVAN